MTDPACSRAVRDRPAAVCSYEFGGLHLSSSFPLPFLVALPATIARAIADIHIELSFDDLPDGRLIHQSAGRYGLALHSFGSDWIFRHRATGVRVDATGRRLVCHCPQPSDLSLLAEILVRRILPKLCYLHGRLPIHAATLGDDAGALLLLGASSSGKSTTTAALARNLGWRIFSDDMSILDDGDCPLALGGVPGVSLWQDAVDGLDISAAHLSPMAGYEGKYAYRPAAGPSAPLPLNAIILLSAATDDSAIRLEPLAGPEVLVMICSQIVPFNPRDPVENADLMRRFNRVAADVPVFALSYPRTYAMLPAVVDTVAPLIDRRAA
ncbi:MAG: hypothetical protein A2885_22105 [Sphingopyxis sp. RIFCSPHIGHO2_01_FULL_65_24]|nr:MAG: hypothetical protein A2885_22105 [Sphingopyxis sp. RIFCSPHIGHO2_01_FULL_65_24]